MKEIKISIRKRVRDVSQVREKSKLTKMCTGSVTTKKTAE